MTGSAALARLSRAPAKANTATALTATDLDPPTPAQPAAAPRSAKPNQPDERATGRHGQSGDERWSPVIRHTLGIGLASLTVAAVGVRQLAANGWVASPASLAEAALGANVFARLNDSALAIPTSFADSVAGWQAAGYSSMTSAIDRYDTLVGPTREFVLVLAVASAALIVAVCRRLHLGWISTALAVGLSGVPAVIGTLRIEAAAGAIATFWIALSALCAILAMNRPSRHSGGHRIAALPAVRWLMVALAAGTAVIAVLTSSVAALLVIGIALGLAAGRQTRSPGHLLGWVLIGILALTAGAIFWLTVLRPAAGPDQSAGVDLVGAGVALGGIAVIVVAYLLVARLRSLAIGIVPILLASAWPGPAQAAASLLAWTAVGVLTARLLDDLLKDRRLTAVSWSGALAVVAAITVGALVLSPAAPTAAAVTPDGQVAQWLTTQLPGDAVVAVDPLTRAQLVRNGVDPDSLTTSGRGREADFVLSAMEQRSDYPLVARFDTDSGRLGLRLVVADTAGYWSAMVSDEADRRRFGAALVGNSSLDLAGPAAAAMASGEVDARLMIALGGAASAARFVITQFTGTGADLDDARIYREVTLTNIALRDSGDSDSGGSDSGGSDSDGSDSDGSDSDGSDSDGVESAGTEPEQSDSSPVGLLADFFRMQQAPYQPLAVLESGSTLTIRYAAPSQLGLLP